MSWPTPTRADHEKFCRTEGWRIVRDSRGRRTRHHLTFELDLPDGRTLRTRVSNPPDRSDYGPALFGHVLRDQLEVDEEQFWACVRGGIPPARCRREAPAAALPADVVHLLRTRVRLSEADIAHLSKEQAVERLARYWTEGR
jgi:hypothetical protein